MSFTTMTSTYNPATHKVVPKDAVVLDLRALVPGDSEMDVALYPNWLREVAKADGPFPRGRVALAIADQIEAQTKPPRIPEPGIYGVVSALGDSRADGRPSVATWVRVDESGTWRRQDNGYGVGWNELTNPVLVRPGV